MNKAALSLENISKSYVQGSGEPLTVLNGISLTLKPGECVGLVGPSGSGKSTLLHIAGLLDMPSQGRVVIEGYDTQTMTDEAKTTLRREKIGFVYQFHHLLPEFTALENVMMPLMIAGKSGPGVRDQARTILTYMGLGERLDHVPSALSGGEQQRVAMARALVHEPRILLADEPTGNLDPVTSERVFQMLLDWVKTKGLSALVATHNLDMAQRMDRVLTLHEGGFHG